jgi:hypothetical protein
MCVSIILINLILVCLEIWCSNWISVINFSGFPSQKNLESTLQSIILLMKHMTAKMNLVKFKKVAVLHTECRPKVLMLPFGVKWFAAGPIF